MLILQGELVPVTCCVFLNKDPKNPQVKNLNQCHIDAVSGMADSDSLHTKVQRALSNPSNRTDHCRTHTGLCSPNHVASLNCTDLCSVYRGARCRWTSGCTDTVSFSLLWALESQPSRYNKQLHRSNKIS